MPGPEKVRRRRSAGQATTEYVMLLLLAFILFRIVQKGLGPVIERFAQSYGNAVEIRFSKGLHRFR